MGLCLGVNHAFNRHNSIYRRAILDAFSSSGNLLSGARIQRVTICNRIKNGTIQEIDLRRCCANVVKSILDSAIQREYIS